ncbi:MAG: phosphodiester glycosidase family protein, partial [Clostridia bacterium]|nr:phosphodiester glycosidase family protein [Clostridia bacterium]
MKLTTKRTICTFILTAMLSQTSLGALSYTGLGEVYDIKRDTVGDGLKYSELYSTDDNGKNQQSYIFEYDPDGGTLPLVRWGNTVYGPGRVGALVKAAEEEGDSIFGALNGDFFSMQTGVPLGVIIDDGKIISSDDSKYALGFKADGSAIIGKPSISINLTNVSDDGAEYKINQFNKYPSKWGVYLLTRDYSDSTHSTENSREIVVMPEDDIPTEGSVYGMVLDVYDGVCDTEIPEGCVVISIAETYADYSKFDDISVGDLLQFDVTCDEEWRDVVTAIGGGDILLDEGEMPEDIIDEDHEKISHPRTAVGIKEDGTVVFFAIDGRISASRGLKITELASVMSELGCVTALNLDGGGSTTVLVRASGESSCVYVNDPADGSYRTVGNAILFMSEAESDGVPSALSLIPNTPYILSGSTVDFSAQLLDSAYMPIDMYLSGDQLDISFAEEYEDGVGAISEKGFTAGNIPGEYRLDVTVAGSDGEISGDVSVIVVDAPDSIKITQSADKIRPGTLVEIDIEPMLGKKELLCDVGSFSFTLNGEQKAADPVAYPGALLICDLGYLDTDGNFQSFGGEGYEGTVEIGISYGEFTETVTVEIGDFSDTVADFETENDITKFMAESEGGNIKITQSDKGYKSDGALEITYDHTDAEEGFAAALKLKTPVHIGKDAESIKLWVSGDISETLSALVHDADGNEHSLEYVVTKDYTVPLGWRELTALIPEDLKDGKLTLDSLISFSGSGTSEGTLLLDGAIIYYGRTEP